MGVSYIIKAYISWPACTASIRRFVLSLDLFYKHICLRFLLIQIVYSYFCSVWPGCVSRLSSCMVYILAVLAFFVVNTVEELGRVRCALMGELKPQ